MALSRKLVIIPVLLFIIFPYSACEEDRSTPTERLLHNDDVKRWEQVGFNDQYYSTASGFILLTKNNEYKVFTYFKNGTFKPRDLGDVVIPEYYKLVNDSLLYLGNSYYNIVGVSNDSLIISGVCGHNTRTYVRSNIPPPR